MVYTSGYTAKRRGSTIGEGGDTTTSFPGGSHLMIPYMVGKLATNPSHLTRGLVKYVPGRGYFRAVHSQ